MTVRRGPATETSVPDGPMAVGRSVRVSATGEAIGRALIARGALVIGIGR